MIFGGVAAYGDAAKTHSFGSFTQNQPYTNSVNPSLLEKEVSKRMSRVAEFKFIREVAAKYDVDIYLFGGTASAFAHYVRWDLLREDGDPRFQPERFDYFFDNIYRSNQDLDIVVDGDAETANKIALELKGKFDHFVGDKEAWEVRLLREQTGDKLPLLDDPDFANQHTDSNSIGIIKISQSKGRSFYDLRDWDNAESLYLNDVASANMTYLFSDKHEATSRYKIGKNPSILSAIRYLAKATQYELKLKDKDLKKIKDIIKNTDLNTLSSYSKNKMSEFALKALLNSPDVEYAWDLLEETGARELAIEADGNQHENKDMISWWLSKEPLRSSAVGQGGLQKVYKAKGETAKELGIDIVAHETNSFQAFDSITRSAKGRPNVFISRRNSVGEAAAHGDGFYTKIGREGARGTGITVRFKVHPDAIKGVDFTIHNDYLVFKNKNALELIPEKVAMNTLDYFKLISYGEIGRSDKGLINRVKSRIGMMGGLNQQEVKEIHRLVGKDLKSGQDSFLAKEWYSLPESIRFADAVDKIFNLGAEFYRAELILHILSQEHWAKHPESGVYLKRVINEKKSEAFIKSIVSKVLSKKYWAKHKDSFDVIKSLIVDKRSYNILMSVLSKDYWASHPRGAELLELFLDRDEQWDYRAAADFVFSKKYWASHPRGAELLKVLIANIHRLYQSHVSIKVLSKKFWVKHPESASLLRQLINKRGDDGAIAEYIFSKKYWAKHSEAAVLLQLYITKASSSERVRFKLENNVFNKKHWQEHSEYESLRSLFEEIIEKNKKGVICSASLS